MGQLAQICFFNRYLSQLDPRENSCTVYMYCTQNNLLIIYTDYKKHIIFDEIFLPDVHMGACAAAWIYVDGFQFHRGNSIKSCVSLQNLCINYKFLGIVCILYCMFMCHQLLISGLCPSFSFVYPFISNRPTICTPTDY